MPGRAFDYMNQNIGLVQGGLDRAQGLGEEINRQEAQNFNRQWMTDERAFQRGEQPASPFQKWTAQQVIKKWFDRKDLPPQVRGSAAKAELHALKNAGQLEGGPTGDPAQDLQQGKEMQVQLPGGSDAAAPGGVPGMSWRNPGGMAGAAPSPIQATAQGPQRQVQLPGEAMAQVDRLPTGEATNIDMSSMFPRTVSATPTELADVPPPPSFLITRSPEGGPSVGGMSGGMAGAQPVPEVKTVRDFNDVLNANREIERWQPNGRPLDDDMALELLKQQGQNYRTGVRSATSDKDRANNMAMTRLKIASREKMFWRSVQNIDNALLLLQHRMSFAEHMSQSSEFDKNLRTQMGVVAKLIGDKGRELAELNKRLDVNQNDPQVIARKQRLMLELGQLNELIGQVEDEMDTGPGLWSPFGAEGPQNQSGGRGSTPDTTTNRSSSYSSEE